VPAKDVMQNYREFIAPDLWVFPGIVRIILLQPLSFIIMMLIPLYLLSCAPAEVKKESGPAVLIENVPFFPQEDYQCGPSSLAGIMNYWGISVTPDEIAREIFSETARGTLTVDMVIYAQKKGLQASQYKGALPDLKKSISAGYPVIVLVDYGIYLYQVNHFMVVVGYDDNGIIVNTGKEANKSISEKDFLKTWKKTGYWTLLVSK
jgi:hypothetical protein